jgi:hypothetical protein
VVTCSVSILCMYVERNLIVICFRLLRMENNRKFVTHVDRILAMSKAKMMDNNERQQNIQAILTDCQKQNTERRQNIESKRQRNMERQHFVQTQLGYNELLKPKLGNEKYADLTKLLNYMPKVDQEYYKSVFG